MKRHAEFIFGITILFFMAVVLWKFIEPKPMGEVVTTQPVQQREDQTVRSGVSDDSVKEEASVVPVIPTKPIEEVSDQAPAETLPTEPTPAEEPVACTMDAKMCPDGSFVGRQGPDCEFTPCQSDDGEDLSPR